MPLEILLMRHGDADWQKTAGCIGWGADLAPLTELGRSQVRDAVPAIKEWGPLDILCSPMTRATESAIIVGEALGISPRIFFELHEWIPKLGYDWRTLHEVVDLQKDLLKCNGEWPEGDKRDWEPLSAIRARVAKVFKRYQCRERILVVAHGVLMYALTGQWEIPNAKLLPISWSE